MSIAHAEEMTDEESETIEPEDDDEDDEGSVVSVQSEEDIDEGWANPFWRLLLIEAYKNMKEIPETVDRVVTEPYLSNLNEQLRRFYDIHTFMTRAKNCSELETKISDTIDYYESKLDFDTDEAVDMAWQNRKFLFKKLILNNEEIFQAEWERRGVDE